MAIETPAFFATSWLVGEAIEKPLEGKVLEIVYIGYCKRFQEPCQLKHVFTNSAIETRFKARVFMRGILQAGEEVRDEDQDRFYEIHVNTREGIWSLWRSWLRPHRGILQEHLPCYLGFCEFGHNLRRRGKALLGAVLTPL